MESADNSKVPSIDHEDVFRILGQPTIYTTDDAMKVAAALKTQVFQVGNGLIHKPFEAKK